MRVETRNSAFVQSLSSPDFSVVAHLVLFLLYYGRMKESGIKVPARRFPRGAPSKHSHSPAFLLLLPPQSLTCNDCL